MKESYIEISLGRDVGIDEYDTLIHYPIISLIWFDHIHKTDYSHGYSHINRDFKFCFEI